MMRRLARIGSRQRARQGLTILEVIISIGIFLASMTIVSQLLGTGSRAAVEARLRSEMALLAESKMGEIVAGIQEMNATSGQDFEDEDTDSAYTWGLEVEEGIQGDLLQVTVTVEHENGQGDVDANFQLSRMMRDPQIWIDAALEAAESSSSSFIEPDAGGTDAP